MTVVTRFAPSPTGLLHLGHACSALVTWRVAGEHGGRVLLRLEDIDTARCRPEFDAAILDDLPWLGLDWDGPVRRQSEHFDDYAATLDRLREDGLVYPCFCTRRQIEAEIAAAGSAPHGPLGAIYPGTCRNLSMSEREDRIATGENHALRLDVAKAARRTGPLSWHEADEGRLPVDPMIGGDVVLARKDTPTSYHLAVTHDDHLQRVSLVTRGEDLKPSTHIHRLLQALLDWDEPRYAHHGLLVGDDGKRFAKRDRSLTLRALREAGKTPDEVIAMAEGMAP
ncbi:MAG: tRNA glutamyl-Q(34) synthetase GluQRS [Rhodospirillales bacterium]|nr:tRNA glutamyl-Q(34) synthetase GluQRS [Rhodospirillales bacterium]